MEKTRSAVKCPLFGEISVLKENVLPTYEDVMKYYEWTRNNLKNEMLKPKEPTFASIAEVVTSEIEKIWQKASLPIVSHTRVVQMLKAYHLKCKNLLKSIKRLTQEKRDVFLQDSRVLFDISSCKCKDINQCSCPQEKRVPKLEHAFLIDQRTVRKMAIGGVDVKHSKILQKRAERKEKLQKIHPTVETSQPERFRKRLLSAKNLESVEAFPAQPPCKKRKILTFSTLAKTCDRYGVSDRAGAAIASSVLHDIQADVDIIDRHKLRRDRTKNREKIDTDSRVSDISALYFDGRKDKTLKVLKKGSKNYRTTVVEEHISLVKEPGSIYLGYVVPASGNAKMTVTAILNYLSKEGISADKLLVLGCDGTNVNTGKYGGVISLMEKKLEKPLQWVICLLHMNELPLRHLFLNLDGATSGPRSYTGQIGKLLETCEQMPVVKFTEIPGPSLPPVSDLSTDQNYLHKIVTAVISGQFPEDLAHKSPGKLSHARWLTRANRILRLYVATLTPSESLVTLANFVVKVYAPVWFAIRFAPSCNKAAIHFFEAVSRSRYLPDTLKKVVDPVLQRNSYAIHPENLLLAMLTDERKEVRETAVRRILQARSVAPSSTPRLFEVPKIILNAQTYENLIDWDQEQITAPPILQNLTDDQIISTFLEGTDNDDLRLITSLPCHTQAVERSVKMTTEASLTSCTQKSRIGAIKLKLESRKVMPKFDTKRDFKAD